MTGFNSKREAAADKLHWNEDEWRRNNWRCGHGWLRGEQCEICNAPQPAQEPVAQWLEDAFREGWESYRDSEFASKITEDWAFGNSLANCRMIDLQQNTTPPQPAQEPVAWITPDGKGFRIRFSPPVNDVPLGWDALYTTPPQRTWIWLSDADIAEVIDTTCQYSGGYEEYLIKKAERKIRSMNS